MKKIIVFSIMTLFLFALAACGTTTTTTESTSTTTTDLGSTTSTTTTETHDPVTVTYAAWNLGVDGTDAAANNLERLMLDAFEVQYPWITVDIIERPKIPDPTGTAEIDQNWNEFLGARAAQGQLPDVYFTDSTETTIMNNWSYDVTALAEADPEFLNISSDIRNAANYGGKIMAIPYAVYYFGYFINKTIFDNANADFPTFEDTWDEFLAKIGDVANQNVTTGNGIAGLCGVDRILEWYPAQLNADLGWYTYDGTILHLDGPDFETALDLYTTLMADKTLVYDALSAEEKTAAFGTTDTWGTSKLAAYWEYTPIIGNMAVYDFDIDFIGTPGTATTHQIPVVLDLMCLSSQTQHPAEAYLLAKWMSFGKDGYLKRIEISNEQVDLAANDGDPATTFSPLNMTPLQPDADMLDAFFAIYPSFIEFRKVVEYDDYILEPNKYVPGYIKARWTGDYDETTTLGKVFDLVRAGEMNYADVKTIWNTRANAALTLARTSVLNKLGVAD